MKRVLKRNAEAAVVAGVVDTAADAAAMVAAVVDAAATAAVAGAAVIAATVAIAGRRNAGNRVGRALH
jgi:hypothetical protein